MIIRRGLLKKDFGELPESLAQNPEQGTSPGNKCYQVRVAITSKGKGKSGGAIVITNLVVSESNVFLLSIYDKSEKYSLRESELKELLKYVPE